MGRKDLIDQLITVLQCLLCLRDHYSRFFVVNTKQDGDLVL